MECVYVKHLLGEALGFRLEVDACARAAARGAAAVARARPRIGSW